MTPAPKQTRRVSRKALAAGVAGCLAVLAVVLAAAFPAPPIADESAATPAGALSAVLPTGQSPDSSADSGTLPDSAFNAEYRPDQVVVTLRDVLPLDQVNERLADLDYLTSQQLTEEDAHFGFAALQLADGVDVKDAVRKIEQTGLFQTVQPNYIYHADESASTQLQGADSGLLRALATSVNDYYVDRQWGLTAVHAFEAWDIAKTNRQVTVAVLDSGILSRHADFKDAGETSSLIVGGYNALNNASSGNYEDDYGHGTHVAGIVAAAANNGRGVAGVSYNAQLLPVKVLDSTGEGDSIEIARGIQYVLDNAAAYNVRVVNMSLGGEFDGTPADQLVLNKLNSMHDANILVVCSAGNSGTTAVQFPVDYDPQAVGVMSVTKSGSNYVRSSFSNYNGGPEGLRDLAAPGENILSTTNVDKGYVYRSGTSMATPFVSGIAALAFAYDSNLSASEVKSALCDTATDLGSSGWDVYYGHGLVNAKALLESIRGNSVTRASGDISSAEVTVASATYTGAELKPAVTVKLGSQTLTQGVHYTLAYANNLNAGEGTASVTVTGIGACSGSVTQSFTINKAPMTNASIRLSATSFVYDGSRKSPTVTVFDVGANAARDITDTCTIVRGSAVLGTGSVSVTALSSCQNYTGTATRSFRVSAARVTVYRLYHPRSGEHHYTKDTNEVRVLTSSYGWRNEGVAWISPAASNTPVYRLYHPGTGEHHYTKDANEVRVLTSRYGWRNEGVGWWSSDATASTQQRVYRVYHPKLRYGHHYTMDANEIRVLTSSYGWRNEGIGWYSL